MSLLVPVQAVVAKADSQVGVREVGGSNRGPEVDAYLARVHAHQGDPWCAAFVGWCGTEVMGSKWPLILTAGCAALGEFAEVRGVLRKVPEYGSIFLIWSESKQRFHHTGFVTLARALAPNGTIEGNTNLDGSVEGIGVFARTRSFGQGDRFISWWELAN